jgi:diguanylate cyclase (GGDEF)-like protein/PAS domain S-box-containing protein
MGQDAQKPTPRLNSLAERLWWSLRFRMLATTGVVLLALLALLIYNGPRLMDRHMVESGNRRIQDLRLLIGAVMSAPLAQEQHAGLSVLAAQLRQQAQLSYVVVVDLEQQIVALQGWEANVELPPRANDLSELPRDAEQFHGMVTLRDGQRALGYVLFGMPADFVKRARAELVSQSIVIGAFAFALAMLVLSLVAYWLTRELRSLERGVAALDQGEARVKLPTQSFSEVSGMARAFNAMSQRLEERVEALRRSEARFHAIADYTFGVEAWFNPRGRLIWVNRAVERMTGHTSLECILAENLAELLVHPKDRKHAMEQAARAQQGANGENVELRLVRKDTTVLWVAINWQLIYSTDGEYLGVRVSAENIQSRKEVELKLLEVVAELRRSQALKDYYLTRGDEERRRIETLLNLLKVGVLFVDKDRRVLLFNKALLSLWGIDENENLAGMHDDALIERTAAQRVDDASFRRHVQDVVALKEISHPHETRLKDGRTIVDMAAPVPGAGAGEVNGRVWVHEDVTQLKSSEERLSQLAERDPLTNLYNRRRFNEELDRMLADAGRRRSQLGLLVIDLDGFKPVNDKYGQEAGDEVLVTLARSVAASVRRNEIFFRLGGDEFAVLAPDSNENDMLGLARRVNSRIAELRFRFAGQEVGLTASLGIAVYPVHAISGEEIIARADYAMYQAKANGRNRCQVYQDPMVH